MIQTNLGEIIMKKSKVEVVEVVEAVEVATEVKPLANINGVYVEATSTLTWTVEKNPKRPSGKAYKRFEAYLGTPTVADYLAAGGTLADLKYDNAKGYITL